MFSFGFARVSEVRHIVFGTNVIFVFQKYMDILKIIYLMHCEIDTHSTSVRVIQVG